MDLHNKATFIQSQLKRDASGALNPITIIGGVGTGKVAIAKSLFDDCKNIICINADKAESDDIAPQTTCDDRLGIHALTRVNIGDEHGMLIFDDVGNGTLSVFSALETLMRTRQYQGYHLGKNVLVVLISSPVTPSRTDRARERLLGLRSLNALPLMLLNMTDVFDLSRITKSLYDLQILQKKAAENGVDITLSAHPLHPDALISVSLAKPDSQRVSYFAFLSDDSAMFDNAPTESYDAILAFFENATKQQAVAIENVTKKEDNNPRTTRFRSFTSLFVR